MDDSIDELDGFPARVAVRVREFLTGPNPTYLNFRDVTADVSWRHAGRRFGSLHTIAELVFHIHFFFRVGLKVLRDDPLDEGDRETHSFEAPAIESEKDWKELVTAALADGEAFAAEVEALSEARLTATFFSQEHGDHFRSLLGTVEHGYYHLGQIVQVKKLLSEAPHPRVGVGCIVLHDRRILLVRSHGGYWSTPGGNLDLGEDPGDCAVRETLEETGVPVVNPEFVAVTHDPMPERGTHYITIWMRAEVATVPTGEVGPEEIGIRTEDEAEIAEAGWFDPEELPAPRHPYLENLLDGRSMPGRPPQLPDELARPRPT